LAMRATDGEAGVDESFLQRSYASMKVSPTLQNQKMKWYESKSEYTNQNEQPKNVQLSVHDTRVSPCLIFLDTPKCRNHKSCIVSIMRRQKKWIEYRIKNLIK
jgi:hypothetical protein